MTAYTRPGTYVTETTTLVNPLTSLSDGAAQAAFLGKTNRGPLTPTFVNSWAEYESIFAGLAPAIDMPWAVYSYFTNGGRGAWIQRVLANNAAAATRTFNDQKPTPGPTLIVNAANPGDWGNGINITLIPHPGRQTFDLDVFLNGQGRVNIVESWTELSLDPTNDRSVDSIINGNSKYIRTVNQLSTATPPNNIPLTQTLVALAGGSNGAEPGTSKYTDGMASLATLEPPLVVNAPAVTDTLTVQALLTAAETNGTMFVVIDTDGGTASEVAVDAAALTATSYGAIYHPRLIVQDPLRGSTGATRVIPPGGAVLGQYMATDASRGVFVAPGGLDTILQGPIVALETILTSADLDTIYGADKPINPIRFMNGVGFCIMGVRTLHRGFKDQYVNVRRSMIHIRKNIVNRTRFSIFENNDYLLRKHIRSVVNNWLNGYWQQGGLKGRQPDNAWFVICDGTNNGQAQVDNGELHITIGVAAQTPMEFLVIQIGQKDTGQSEIVEV